jgi:hypothetical protein
VKTVAVSSRPLTRAQVAELVERIRQLLADPDAHLTGPARIGATGPST